MPAIYIDLASHWLPYGLYRNMYLAGTFLSDYKDPFAHSCRGIPTHNNMVWGLKSQWRHWTVKVVCISFLCFSSFVHETLRLVSDVGEFLWSGEQSFEHDVQCFPGGHWYEYQACMLFRVRVHRSASQSIPNWLVIDHHVDYTETCTLLRPSCWVGGRPAGGEDPVAHSWKGVMTHNIFSDNGLGV